MDQTGDKATKSWILAITSLGSLMAVLDAMVVATALTSIRADLGASLETLEWTMNAYNLSFAVLLLTGAALGDRFGRQRMFVSGLALFVAASVACALANSAGWLIAARAVQGAGAALVMPLAMALLSAAFPPEERARALGLFSGITGLALITGPVLGGAIAEGARWQWIFWINLPIGLILIPLALRKIPESFGQSAAIDGFGVVIVTGAAFGLVWALMRGNQAGWTSYEFVCTAVAGALLALGFIFWEMRASHPMVPMRFFRSQAFSSGIGASVLFYAGMYGVLFLLPQYFQSAQEHGPLAAGLRLLPWTATLFVVAPIAGRFVNQVGERSLIVAGLMLQAIGFAWIGLIATPELPYVKLVLPLIIAGSGVSMAMPAAQSAVLNSVAKPEIGKASGIFNMFRFLGGVSGIALDVAVFSAVGGLSTVQSFSAGFATATGVSALLSLGGAIVGLWQPGRVKAATLDSASARS
jgi:EmrB/QacA subfamily drug resistance transporter